MAGEVVLLVADHRQQRRRRGTGPQARQQVEQQVGADRATCEHADRSVEALRHLAGLLQCLPRAIEEQAGLRRSEENTSELQSRMLNSNAGLCLKKKKIRCLIKNRKRLIN